MWACGSAKSLALNPVTQVPVVVACAAPAGPSTPRIQLAKVYGPEPVAAWVMVQTSGVVPLCQSHSTVNGYDVGQLVNGPFRMKVVTDALTPVWNVVETP